MKNIKEEKLVPKLRFKEFKDKWKNYKFSDLFYFIPNNSLSRTQLTEEKRKILNIHYGDIHKKFQTSFDIRKESVPYIQSQVEKEKNYFLKEGDLIIADASEDYKDIGKTIEIINLDNQNVEAGLHTIPARLKTSSSIKGFYGNLMKTWRVRQQIMTLSNGISVLGISKANLSSVKLRLPSEREQDKISSFLTLIDKRIEQLSKKKELLEQYKKGVMQKIFRQEIRFKDEYKNRYGEWKVNKFGDIFNRLTPKPYEIYSSQIVATGNIPVVDQGRSHIAGYTDIIEKTFSLVPVIIFGDHTTIIKYIDFPFVIGADGVQMLKEKDNHNLLFLYYLLSSLGIKQDGYKRHFSMLKKNNLQIPLIEEQNKIASILKFIDNNINKLDTHNVFSELYKKSLLQQMFV